MSGESRDRADLFLDRYRELEEALNQKYGVEDKVPGSPVVRFINGKESKHYREKLDLCREIRNFLSHHSEVDGERVIQPSLSMIRFLEEVTDYVRQPPLGLECATLYADILKTSYSQKVSTVMKKMERQGYSHVPVIDKGECVGVFSVSTIFTFLLDKGMTQMRDDMTIGDFADYLDIDRHSTERFAFVSKEATMFELRQIFERKNRGGKRLAAIFITDSGSSKGRIMGMVTPNDLINY